jgi:hypothetical protein
VGTDQSPTDAQYLALAKEYLKASKEFGNLTIVSHREVDRGISGAHSDPYKFDFDKFYRILEGLGVDLSKVNRISQERHDVPNLGDQKTNWPPVLNGPVEKKSKEIQNE